MNQLFILKNPYEGERSGPTLGSRLEVGDAGASGLDVRGLEGGQDEGHLSAIRRQLGQQVVVHNQPVSVRLLS